MTAPSGPALGIMRTSVTFAAVLLAAGCGANGTPAPIESQSPPAVHRLGESAVISLEDGGQLTISLTAFDQHAARETATNCEYIVEVADCHYAAGTWTIRNTGHTVFEDKPKTVMPTLVSTATDTTGVDHGEGSADLDDALPNYRLQPGKEITGSIAYVVPGDAVIEHVRIGERNQETTEWVVR